jgi:lipopolysaccharide/colanic/teichoic acid biosynthesis glycosyltransferase
LRVTGAYKSSKRMLDILVGGLAFVMLLPVLAVIAMVVRVVLGAPILFTQPRPGRYGKVFQILKFRTMSDRRDERGQLLSDEQRLGWFGTVLRSTSLDELPELWNVLKGDMSLVGPRPLLVQYLPRYTAWQRRRHDVRPGITGWAQVNGRNLVSWTGRFELDVWYVENYSLRLDLKILAMTVIRVFQRSGISQAGHVTMPEFAGEASQSRD